MATRGRSILLATLTLLGLGGCAPAKPVVLTWWVNIDRYYSMDQGGPQATAAARRAVLALRQAGVDGLPIKTHLPEAQIDWMIRLADQCRMKRVCILGWTTAFGYAPPTAARTWYGPGRPPGPDSPEFQKSPHWIYHEALHDGHAACRPSDGAAPPLCHNYRGRLFDDLFRHVEWQMRRVRPDYVLVDHEMWVSPEEQEKACPGVVTTCSRCRGLDGARRGWQEWVDRHVRIARTVNPKVQVYFYGTGVCWPTDAGDGPSPALYNLKAHSSGRSSYGPADLIRMKDPRGGLPWLMFQPYHEQAWPTEQDVAWWCRLLRQAGAKGFLVYSDLLPDERANRLIRAGVEAWREK